MPTASLAASLSPSSLSLPAVTIVYSEAGGSPRLALTGAQTYPIDIAMMPSAGLRGLRIAYATTDAAGVAVTAPLSIRLTVASVVQTLPLSPGGFLALADPSPSSGITAISIVTTGNAVVSVEALG